MSVEVISFDTLRGFGGVEGELAFAAACEELDLSVDQCEALRQVLDGDTSKLRDMAVLAASALITAKCTEVTGGAGAPLCALMAQKITTWVDNLVADLGLPSYFAPCAIPLKGTTVADLDGRFFLSTTASNGFADLVRGFEVWPEAKSMMLVKRAGCSGHTTWQVFPGRSWLRGGGKVGWIDWPPEALPAGSYPEPDRRFVIGRDGKQKQPQAPLTAFNLPGHYRIDPDNLPSILNGAIETISESVCPPGTIRNASGACITVFDPTRRKPQDPDVTIQDPPKSGSTKRTSTGVKVAVGVSAAAGGLLLLSRVLR